MTMFRNILTAVWCAIIIGTNTFALIVTAQHHGLDMLTQGAPSLPLVQMVAMVLLGVMSLVSTKYLWGVLGVAVVSLFMSLNHEIFTQPVWRPSSTLGGLALIIPTYLLARWNSLSREPDFNPVQEF